MINPLRRFTARIREFFTLGSDALTRSLGYSRSVRSSWTTRAQSLLRPTQNWGRSDYAWWRRAYYCHVRGLELSGLFIKPLVSKISGWALGRLPEFRCENEQSQQALDEWSAEHHADILRAYRASLKQGDSFVVVNSDLSVTVLAPDNVEPIVADDDYGEIIGWRVTQVILRPDVSLDRQIVIDEYYIDRRVQRVQFGSAAEQTTVYPNLIGRLPVVLIANNVNEDETFGHPEAEALIEVLHRYGEIFEAAIEGNKRQGRPTPVLTFASGPDLDRFWSMYGVRSTTTSANGTSETQEVLNIDLSQLLTVSGAQFEYKAPGQFTQDTETLLGLMFYLILENSELPEFVFGNAVASSKASVETQMPVFEVFIAGRRAECSGWLSELAEIVLAYSTLTTPGVTVETPTLQWQKLTQDGRLTLDALVWALSEDLIDKRTALMLAPVQIEDVDHVLDLAEQEGEQKQAQAQQQTPNPAQTEQTPAAQEMASPSNADLETSAIVLAAERIISRNGHGD